MRQVTQARLGPVAARQGLSLPLGHCAQMQIALEGHRRCKHGINAFERPGVEHVTG